MKKVLFGVAGAIIIGLGATGYYSTTLISSDKILSNVYVADINLGDLTKEEALGIVKKSDEKTGINITMYYGETKYEVDASEFGYAYDVEGAVEKAYKTGRGESFVGNMMTALSQEVLGAKEKIEPPLKLMTDNYNKVFDMIANDIETAAIDASIRIDSGNIIINEGSNGVAIDRKALESNIKTQLDAKELFRVDQETSYTADIPVMVKEQTVKSDNLKKVTGIIGEYTTNYNAGTKGRNNNITLASKSINDKIIKPGETLSYNEAIGEITYANGYMDDTVIVNGEIEQGVGGGVCQVSSTLYNAALYANMDIVQRRNHSVPSNYTPISRDAVISYGTIDLVLKNPYDYPLVVKSGTSNGTITVQIYGNVETAPKVTLSSEIIGSKARGLVYISDSSLPIGTEKVKTVGRDQIQGRLYKTVNGVTTTVSTDIYPAKNKEVLRGTKPIAIAKPATQEQTTTPKENTAEVVPQTPTPDPIANPTPPSADEVVDALIGQ